jgi:HD-like signal output (HDOD) protein
MPLLDAPLESVDAYVEFIFRQEVPVLRRTVREFEALRTEQDSVSGRRVAAVVLGDPLMTMRLLTHLQANRSATQNHDITTIDRAIMMMGITPFFNTFAGLPTLEDALAAHPRALVGVLKVIARARKAAHYAREWAIIRHDLDVDEVTVAALLHEATEIMCWTFSPALTQQVYALQQADPSLRSSTAQRAVFGVTAREIQLAAVHAWKLPELLLSLIEEAQADHPRVRNVRLATDFARHLARGWDDPALHDDLTGIGKLLHLGREQLLIRLGVPAEVMSRFLPAAAE